MKANKIMAASAAALIVEPAMILAHQGGVGVIVGLGIAGAAYLLADDIKGKDTPSPAAALPSTEKLSRHASSLGYRLLNGKSTREQIDADAKTEKLPEEAQAWEFEGDEDIALPVRRNNATLFTLSDVLRDFKPSIDRIYLGEREDGSPVFCSAKKLFHVALAGKTGRGKGSLMRLLLAQLCSLRLDILLLNPHYMRWVYTDSGNDEDWTPFEPYLKVNPLDCTEVPEIESYLRWCVEKLLEDRKARSRAGQRPGKPFFIVIDELPAIIAESKRCADYIAKILNQGRKYGIFMIVASQNFQVKSVSGDTAGADRENYETGYYVGGDGTTAKVLLDMPVNQIPETSLGRGVAMLRCAGTPDAEKAVKVRVPFTDNAALYRLLGPSTFQKSDEPNTDDLSDIGKMFEELQKEQVSAVVDVREEQEDENVILGKGVSITKEQFRMALKLRETGKSTGYRDLMDFFDLSEHHAKELNTKIRQELGLEVK